MKRLLILVAVIGILSSLALAQTASNRTNTNRAQGNAEQQLRQTDREWSQVNVSRDLGVFDRIAAPEYVFISPDGSVNTRAAERTGLSSGQYRFESLETNVEQVQVHGNTAIVIGRATVRGRIGEMDISGPYRYMTVYVKRQGRWQAVSEQVTRIVQAGTQP